MHPFPSQLVYQVEMRPKEPVVQIERKQAPQDEYFERLERYRKFNSDQKVLAVLQELGQMGFTEFDKKHEALYGNRL
jgi:hypothetical protein